MPVYEKSEKEMLMNELLDLGPMFNGDLRTIFDSSCRTWFKQSNPSVQVTMKELFLESLNRGKK